MSRRWTVEDVARNPWQKLILQPQDARRGSRRVGGRYVQRGTAGKREALGGQFFRSRWEACVAAWLQWQGIAYEYEPQRFEFPGIKGRNASILIDFHLLEDDVWWEVKGYMSADDTIKIKRLRRWFPLVRLEIIGQPFFREICRQRVCRLIPAYECRHTGYGA